MVKMNGKNLIRALKFNIGFLTKAQSSILSAAAIISVTTGITAILGIVKSYSLSAFFGTSSELTVFFTADKIPNLIYSLLVVGVLSTIFVPVYTEAIKKDEEKANEIASLIINAGILLFMVLGGIAFVLAKPIIGLLSVKQFSAGEIALGTKLLRLMLGAQIILLVSSFLTSLLHSYNHFLLPSIAPIFYNLGIILGTIFLSEKFGIFGPTYGMLLGAFGHLLIQIPSIKRLKYKYKPIIKIENIYIKKILTLTPPRILSVLIANLLETINNSFAILISKPSSVYLRFAGQLQFFPINLFAISISSAALPTLSRTSALANREKFKKIFITSLHQMLFLVVPCSVILLVLRIPVIRLAFGAKKFPWEATVKTSYTLAFYSLSIFAQSTIYLITRSFYALKDTSTPVKVSLITLPANVILSLTSIKILGWGVWAIALSYSITSIMDMVILFWLLSKKLGGFELKEIVRPFVKISYAAAIMGISLYIPLKILDEFVFDSTRTIQLLLITGLTSFVGIATYLGLTKILKVEEIELLHRILRKMKPKKILEERKKETSLTEIDPIET